MKGKIEMYLDDMHLGMEVVTPPIRIQREKMIAFAQEYDPLPLHTDEEYARTTRFGKLIAPGVMTFMSVWSKIVENAIFDDELIAGRSTKIEWFKPVFADDTLVGKGKITRITRRNPYNGVMEFTVEIFNQHGELVMTNVTESVMSYRT